MILAAGLGTRLKPLTDDRPKALVEVAGHTLLEIVITRLKSFGVGELIINVHYFADMVVAYLSANQNFGIHIEVSREKVLLDTGGGLKKAAHFFLDDSHRADEPFILHNVDVISTIDLPKMVQFHRDRRALATLAVQCRETSRYLLFDEKQELCGRRAGHAPEAEMARPCNDPLPLAFCGVHVISPCFLKMVAEDGVFSIITPYLRLAAQDEKIMAFRADDYYWQDLGKQENLKQAAEDAQRGLFPL
ncbi:MAG TPA: nucleotidyltransferase family protein [Candidatus Acidoferrales bacterium]|jgi:NDP-sugar pyrophosphorylase family protein|nr:nucleotidyltransferase family protein [Candidatus Acidoferrales bacterium]